MLNSTSDVGNVSTTSQPSMNTANISSSLLPTTPAINWSTTTELINFSDSSTTAASEDWPIWPAIAIEVVTVVALIGSVVLVRVLVNKGYIHPTRHEPSVHHMELAKVHSQQEVQFYSTPSQTKLQIEGDKQQQQQQQQQQLATKTNVDEQIKIEREESRRRRDSERSSSSRHRSSRGRRSRRSSSRRRRSSSSRTSRRH